jgi:hypothetical protein
VSKPVIWSLSLVAGVVAAFLSTLLGWFAVGLVLFLFVPVILRPVRLVALSGLLTGFGGSWLLLLGNQALSGGQVDGAGFWTMVGLVPLALGLVALAISVVRARRPGPASVE